MESHNEKQSGNSWLRIRNTKVWGYMESQEAAGLPHRLPGVASKELFSKKIERARKLAMTPPGTGHDCFLSGIIVQATVIAPTYWWPQLQRYHHVEIVSSTSVMHKLGDIASALLALEDAPDRDLLIMKFLRPFFCPHTDDRTLLSFASCALDWLGKGEKDIGALRCNLPSGYLQEARITTNFRQLKTIYLQRRSHPLHEWQEFCDFIRELPHSDLIIGEEKIHGNEEASKES